MENDILAQFTVCISSVKDATWQGTVISQGDTYEFQSEMQLLKWLWETYPSLKPDNKLREQM